MFKRVNYFIILFLVLICAYLSADLFSFYLKRVWDVPHGVSFFVPTEQKANKVEQRDRGYYDIISKRDLFLINPLPEELDMKKERVDEVVPLTELKLKLLGTMVGNGLVPYAIIKDMKSRSQDVYRVGDMVGPAEVVKIYRNKVILRRNGVDEMLVAFEELEDVQDLRDDRESVAEEASPSESIPRRQTPRDVYAHIGEKIAPNHWVIKRTEVDDMMGNATSLLTQVRIVPHFQEGDLGKPDGFQVANIPPRSFFDRMGLRSGDIIKSVNGEIVNNPESAFEAYQRLKNESRIQVNILRRGKDVNLVYDIND